MDRLFATLLTLYVLGAIIVAIIRRLRTGMGEPTLPPVAHPDLFPWGPRPEAEGEAERGVDGEPSAGPASAGAPPLERGDTPSASVEGSPGPEPVLGPEALVRPHEPPAPESLLAPRPEPTAQGRTPAPAAAVRLTPAAVREALIVSELLAPPRSLRPYRPWPRRRS